MFRCEEDLIAEEGEADILLAAYNFSGCYIILSKYR